MARRPYTGRTTSPYGPRLAPIKGASTFHAGVDGVGGYNTAPRAGRVTAYGYVGGWGNRISFVDDGGTLHYLAHNAPGGLLVPVGSRVTEGRAVGVKGLTGTATGVHVHWETRPGGGGTIDPEAWLRSQGSHAGDDGTPIPAPPKRKSADMMMIHWTEETWIKAGKAGEYNAIKGPRNHYLVFGDTLIVDELYADAYSGTQGTANGYASQCGGPSVLVSEAKYNEIRARVVANGNKAGGAVTVDSAAIAQAIADALSGAAFPTAKQVAEAVVTELKLPGN